MKFYISLFLFAIVFASSAQNKLSDKIYFGGGFGFSTSSNQTNLSLSPQVGYKITDRLSSGVGISYQYVKIKNPSVSINNYGWSVFSRFNAFREFFAYTEFEKLYFEYINAVSPEQTNRKGYNSWLVGAGYSEKLGGKASFSFMALYNVLYDETAQPRPYNSPWVIRAGIGIGVF